MLVTCEVVFVILEDALDVVVDPLDLVEEETDEATDFFDVEVAVVVYTLPSV